VNSYTEPYFRFSKLRSDLWGLALDAVAALLGASLLLAAGTTCKAEPCSATPDAPVLVAALEEG
jgi:hypothetical protein